MKCDVRSCGVQWGPTDSRQGDSRQGPCRRPGTAAYASQLRSLARITLEFESLNTKQMSHLKAPGYRMGM